MVRFLLVFFCWLAAHTAFAQIKFPYNQVGLAANQSLNGFCVDTGNTATASTVVTDDLYSNIIDIGFDFYYFGRQYKKCVLGDNGVLSFDTLLKYVPAPFYWNSSSQNKFKNSILPCFLDLFMVGNGSVIKYQTKGQIGERYFIAEWCNIPKYGSAGICSNDRVSFQVVLYEGSNIIEFNILKLIGSVPCPSTNAAAKGIQGVIDTTFSNAIYTPGRGATDLWASNTILNNATRFIPKSSDYGYIIDTAATFEYKHIIWNVDLEKVKWYVTGDPNPIGSGPCIDIPYDPSRPQYIALLEGYVACDSSTFNLSDTLDVAYQAPVSIAHLSAQGFSIFPNPVTGLLHLKSQAELIEEVSISDGLGRIYYRAKKIYAHSYQSDVSQFKSGMYFVHIKTKSGTTVAKLIKL